MPPPTYCSSRRKRALDIVIGLLASLPAAAVLLVTAVVVRVTLGRGVLFPQRRAGRGGEPITVWKLRTMTDARDASGELLPDEQRITRVGRFIRAASIDELPQLWNVLRGEMSIVGPRPLLLSYVDRYTPEQRRRLDAKPGITGWSQAQGRNALSWPERFTMDAWYVEKATLRLDLRIIAMTFRAVLGRHDVSAADHATMPEFMGGS